MKVLKVTTDSIEVFVKKYTKKKSIETDEEATNQKEKLNAYIN